MPCIAADVTGPLLEQKIGLWCRHDPIRNAAALEIIAPVNPTPVPYRKMDGASLPER